MMTSDINMYTDISATISQLDAFNNNVKLLKHFDKSFNGDKDPLHP